LRQKLKIQNIMSNSNEQILAVVDGKITNVEAAIKRLDELTWAHSAISEKITKAKADETSALDGTLSEDKAVAALVQARTLKDVHGSRLADVTAKVASQKQSVIAAGRVARQYTSHVAQLHSQHKLAQSVKFCEEFFERSAAAERLANQSKAFLASERVAASFGAYNDDVNEIASLRQMRDHFTGVVEAVKSEPDFKLSIPDSWVA
jgi:hypothetical protein